MSKPTILFVHGSWHSPKHWQPMRDLAEEQGYPTVCPQLPSFDAKDTKISLPEDAACIKAELQKLVEEQGKDVIVVMHSYGGVVGTEAVHESFGKKHREAKGLIGGVIRLLYLCAFVLREGASLATALGGLPPFIPVTEDGNCTMEDPARRFYNELSQQEKDHWVSELRTSPVATQLAPITYIAYKHHPATYLLCEGDEALPVGLQRMMISNSGVDFQELSCTAGHSPYLSQREAVLNVIKAMTT